MKFFYIDFTLSVPTPQQKYHGGGNYTKNIVLNLIGKKEKENKFILIFPNGFKPKSDVDKEIINSKSFDIIYADSIVDVEYKTPAVLFIPLFFGFRCYKNVVILKNKYSLLKIYATIHDLRNFDYHGDKFEKYYNDFHLKEFIKKKLKRLFLLTVGKFYAKKAFLLLDKIFTVSNYSMQQILSFCPEVNIQLYYQSIIFREPPIKEDNFKEDFLLFVSGNRPDKNLLRTLIAYQSYCNNYHPNVKLYITGIEEKLLEKFSRCKNFDYNKIRNNIKILNYVSDSQLILLYKKCRYLIYTSQSEGFGLPLLEAAIYGGKTAIASNRTSIPEVLGSSVFYVSPNSIKSIYSGFVFFHKATNLEDYTKRITNSIENINEKMYYNLNAFFNDFFN